MVVKSDGWQKRKLIIEWPHGRTKYSSTRRRLDVWYVYSSHIHFFWHRPPHLLAYYSRGAELCLSVCPPGNPPFFRISTGISPAKRGGEVQMNSVDIIRIGYINFGPWAARLFLSQSNKSLWKKSITCAYTFMQETDNICLNHKVCYCHYVGTI